MCNLYNSLTRGPKIVERYRISWASPELSDVPEWVYPRGRYRGAVIRRRDDELGLDVMTWGPLPAWAKEPDWKKFKFTNNARAATVDSLASFRAPFRSRRCVVPAQAYAEYVAVDGRKVRHHVERADGEPLLFAGLWDRLSSKDGSEEVYSYTIITTEPQQGLRWIHHRIPVVLTAEAAREWLDPKTTPERAKELLVSPTPDQIRAEPE